MYSIRAALLIFLFCLQVFSEETTTTTTVNTKPWVELEARVIELRGKVKAKEDELKKLIEAKRFLPDGSKELAEMGKTIQAEHKALSGIIEDYERSRNQLRFRFPERMSDESKFNKMQLQSVPQIEEAMGIDAKIDRNMEKMRRQYPSPDNSVDPSVVKSYRGNATPTTVPAKPIDQQGPIIIKK